MAGALGATRVLLQVRGPERPAYMYAEDFSIHLRGSDPRICSASAALHAPRLGLGGRVPHRSRAASRAGQADTAGSCCAEEPVRGKRAPPDSEPAERGSHSLGWNRWVRLVQAGVPAEPALLVEAGVRVEPARFVETGGPCVGSSALLSPHAGRSKEAGTASPLKTGPQHAPHPLHPTRLTARRRWRWGVLLDGGYPAPSAADFGSASEAAAEGRTTGRRVCFPAAFAADKAGLRRKRWRRLHLLETLPFYRFSASRREERDKGATGGERRRAARGRRGRGWVGPPTGRRVCFPAAFAADFWPGPQAVVAAASAGDAAFLSLLRVAEGGAADAPTLREHTAPGRRQAQRLSLLDSRAGDAENRAVPVRAPVGFSAATREPQQALLRLLGSVREQLRRVIPAPRLPQRPGRCGGAGERR